MTLLPPFSLPTPIPFYIEKLKEEIDEEISRTNDKSNTRKSHVSCSLVSLLALPPGSSIYTSASHWSPKTTNNNYYEQKETSNQKYLQRPAFPPLSKSVYISLCFFYLRFSSSLLHISSLYIRSHLYSLSWEKETSDQTSRHATHEYSVFPQPIVLHTAYSTHLPYPVTFKKFISKVMFCVTFRKRFLVR
jgi:hypothetical protein